MSIDVLPTHRTVEQSGLAGFPLLVARMLDDFEEQQCWHRLPHFQGLSIGLYGVYDVRGVLEKKKDSQNLLSKPNDCALTIIMYIIFQHIRLTQDRVGIPNGYLDIILFFFW